MSIIDTISQEVLPAYIELFELDATPIGGTIQRFTNVASANPISFGGNQYVFIPARFSGVELKSDGSQSRPKIELSNVNRLFLGAVIALGDLVGARLKRLRTFEPFLDSGATPDPAQAFIDQYVIARKEGHNASGIVFELCTPFEAGMRKIPSRLITRQGDSRYGRFPAIGKSRAR